MCDTLKLRLMLQIYINIGTSLLTMPAVSKICLASYLTFIIICPLAELFLLLLFFLIYNKYTMYLPFFNSLRSVCNFVPNAKDHLFSLLDLLVALDSKILNLEYNVHPT